MSTANKWAYITKVVYDALESDTNLMVLKALNKNVQPNASRILVYPFIVAGVQSAETEYNKAKDGTMTVRIWCDVAVPLEGASPMGKSLEAYANALSRIEKAIATITVPSQETHADGSTTIIYGVNLTTYGGHVDNGDTKIEADCDVTVNYASLR